MRDNDFSYCSKSEDQNCSVKTFFGATILIFVIIFVIKYCLNQFKMNEHQSNPMEQLTASQIQNSSSNNRSYSVQLQR